MPVTVTGSSACSTDKRLQKIYSYSFIMITLSHISKWISNASARTFILKDINLTVQEGEFISIMGPSGSGKSTLLNVIGMLDEPDEGDYYFNGEDVLKLKEKARSALYKKHIG